MSAIDPDEIHDSQPGNGGKVTAELAAASLPQEIAIAQLAAIVTPKTETNLFNTPTEFYNCLCKVQAELDDLLTILNSIRKGQTVLSDHAQYIETTKSNLLDWMRQIKASPLPKEIENQIHTISHMHNAWEQMQVSPLLVKPSEDPDAQKQLHYLDILDEQIHKFSYRISTLLVPHQLQGFLDLTHAGNFIPFHDVFASTVPEREDRDRLLKYIALSPHLTPGGFVDVENGRVYRYSTNPLRRLLSMAMILVALGLATGIVYGACKINASGWPLNDEVLPRLMVAWAAILIGMVVHIIVGSAKRAKTQSGVPSGLTDMVLIIEARFGDIVWKFMLGLVGLFGLVFISSSWLTALGIAAPETKEAAQAVSLTQVTPLNAFLIGYSLDSIVELFGSTLEGTSQVKGFIKKV